MNDFILALFVLFAGGVLVPFSANRYKSVFFAGFVFAGSLFVLKFAFRALFAAQVPEKFFLMPYPIGEIRFSCDPMSAFFLVVIALGSIFSSVYAVGYLKPYEGKDNLSAHYFLFSLLIISMFLVVTVQNVIAFLIVWEIMSVSSFFLVAFEYEKNEVVLAGLKYLITMNIGLIFILIGFVVLSVKSASFDFEAFRNIGLSRKWTDLIFVLFFIGFGTKAGFVPFHTWLPHAHPAAPSHVSAIMSAVMIKTGIYGILRSVTFFQNVSVEIPYLVIFISVLTCVLGIMNASAQKEAKKLLAYSSVENIGIIGLGIGFGILGNFLGNKFITIFGYMGAFAHIINHSFFKSLLFFCVGSVYQKTHTLNMEKLGGLIKRMPLNSMFFLVGSVAICAFPLFNGFISEIMIYLSALSVIQSKSPLSFAVAIMSISSLAFTGAIAMICFSKIFGIMFLGEPRESLPEDIGDPSKPMLLAESVLALICLAIGLVPQMLIYFVQPVVQIFLSDNTYTDFGIYFKFMNKISLFFLVFCAIFALLFFVRAIFLRGKKVSSYKTWGCGYQSSSAKIQYTGSSYSDFFMRITKPFIKIDEKQYYPRGLFPKKGNYHSVFKDMVDYYVVYPLVKLVRRTLDLFGWIQSGNTQRYILYGLVFLVLAIIWVLWW